MPVEFAVVKRAPVAEQILVVGNLIGAATVQVVPRVNGRLATVNVQLGDSVTARPDRRQGRGSGNPGAGAAGGGGLQGVARRRSASATPTSSSPRPTTTGRRVSTSGSCCRSRPTTTPSPGMEAAQAQNDLANAQFEQAKARLEELKITLGNTIITSPVDGFVSKRFSDPGAFVGPNSPVVVGGRHPHRAHGREPRREGREARARRHAARRSKSTRSRARSSPAASAAWRRSSIRRRAPRRWRSRSPTAAIRLKPGMYSRVSLTVDRRANALTVPRNALVEIDGKPGVFIATAGGRRPGRRVRARAPGAGRTRRHGRRRCAPAVRLAGPVRVSHRAPRPSRPSSCPSRPASATASTSKSRRG